MRTLRLATGYVGVLVAAYGGWLALSRQDFGQLVEIGIWLAAGILAHDALLTGLVLTLALLGGRLLAAPWRAPAVVALVVWGGLTVAVVPVLGRFGARPDNPTLLDRPYARAWLLLSVVVLAAVVVAGVVRSRRRRAVAAAEPPVEMRGP